MRNLDFLLPFALPPAEFSADLLRAMQTPALAMLLGRANITHCAAIEDGFARALPHERWLATQCGYAAAQDGSNSPPFAAGALAASLAASPRRDDSDGLDNCTQAGVWFLLQPVHFHITRDHLVLTDRRQLDLADTDARILFDLAVPSFTAAGLTLIYGDAQHWFVRADAWRDLQTATPDAACGHNIDIWMPRGDAARAWRRLQNEVQMEWHASNANADREARRQKPVNSLWLWGAAPAETQTSATYQQSLNLPYGLGAQTGKVAPSLTALLAGPLQSAIAVDDSLSAAALAGDWSEWLQAAQLQEIQVFAPLLAALQTGQLDSLRLIASHSTALTTFTLTRNGLRKFWRRPSLEKLTLVSATTAPARTAQ